MASVHRPVGVSSGERGRGRTRLAGARPAVLLAARPARSVPARLRPQPAALARSRRQRRVLRRRLRPAELRGAARRPGASSSSSCRRRADGDARRRNLERKKEQKKPTVLGKARKFVELFNLLKFVEIKI